MPRLFLASLLLSGFAGCVDTTDSVPPPPTKTALSPDAEEDTSSSSPVEDSTLSSERKAFDGLAFIVPEDWDQAETSAFVTARFYMPTVGSDLEVTLSTAGGGADANVDRWRGQFVQSREEIIDTIRVAAEDATLVDLQGQFSPGFGKEANGEWRMVGIIVPLGTQHYFIKLTGPVDQVSAIEETFLAFVRSAAKE